MKRLLGFTIFALALCLMGAGTASATTYYVSSGIGSDLRTPHHRAQSKATPWKHAPYMHSFTGTYSHSSGDRFVFRGGDTWVASDYFVISNGGTSSAPDYYGVDQTWFAGGSWTRPIFDIQASLPNQDSFNKIQTLSL